MAKKKSSSIYYVRDPRWVAVKTRSSCFFLKGEDRLELETPFMAELTRLLDGITAPVARKDFDSLVRSLSTVVPADQVQNWVSALREQGILLEGAERALLEKLQGFVTFAPAEKVCGHLVFCITGSVQASAAGRAVLELMQMFAEKVDVVITEAAEKFYNPELLIRSGARVWRKTTEIQGGIRVPHVQLARAADLVIVFPASAAAISRIAQGACSDLTSMISIATRAPVVIVPGLNEAMWKSPAVQRNVALLERDGFYIVHPGPGVALADADEPKVAIGHSGLSLEDLSDLPYVLMHVMAIHAELRK